MQLVYSQRQHLERLTSLDDRELVRLIQQGDSDGLETLILRKSSLVVALAYKVIGDYEESKDIAQLVFVKVWENIRKYDPTFSFNTWIFRITTNLAIDFLRSRRSRDRMQQGVFHNLKGLGGEAGMPRASRLETEEVDRIFQETSSVLTEKQKQVFVLKEIEGLESKEVAEILNCRESTVRNHLFNARKLLQREVLRRFPEYASRAEGRR